MSLLGPTGRQGSKVLTPPAPSAGSSAPTPTPAKFAALLWVSVYMTLLGHQLPSGPPQHPVRTAFVSVGTTALFHLL